MHVTKVSSKVNGPHTGVLFPCTLTVIVFSPFGSSCDRTHMRSGEVSCACKPHPAGLKIKGNVVCPLPTVLPYTGRQKRVFNRACCPSYLLLICFQTTVSSAFILFWLMSVTFLDAIFSSRKLGLKIKEPDHKTQGNSAILKNNGVPSCILVWEVHMPENIGYMKPSFSLPSSI